MSAGTSIRRRTFGSTWSSVTLRRAMAVVMSPTYDTLVLSPRATSVIASSRRSNRASVRTFCQRGASPRQAEPYRVKRKVTASSTSEEAGLARPRAETGWRATGSECVARRITNPFRRDGAASLRLEGQAEHRTVRDARRRVFGGAVASAAGGRLPSGGDPARGDPERGWRNAAAGDSHGQGPHRPNRGQIRAGAKSGRAVPPGELRLPAGTRRQGCAAGRRSPRQIRPLLRGGRRSEELLGCRFILPPGLLDSAEEGGLALYHFDP